MSAKDRLIDHLIDRLAKEGMERFHIQHENDIRQRSVEQQHERIVASLRAQLADARAHLQPKTKPEILAHGFAELYRVVCDAHSLIDRADLPDVDKVKSIHGLIDQVMVRDWFPKRPPKEEPEPEAADDDSTRGASVAGQTSPSPKPTRRTTRRG